MAERADPVPPATQFGTVGIVLVNYRTADLTLDALASLEPEVAGTPGSRVVIVDNASPDGSAQKIADEIGRRGWSLWAELLAQPRNGGFGYGNNVGMRHLLGGNHPPEFFWLLNTDTIVRPGALQALLQFMRTNPSAGIAGSRLEHPDGVAQHSAFRFHSVAGEFESAAQIGLISRALSAWAIAPTVPDAAAAFDWVAGASMLMRRAVIDDIGFFDEGYFLYYEETDICFRARENGWQTWYVPASRVVHLVGQSTGVTNVEQQSRQRPLYWFQSRRRYFIKHHGVAYAALADIALAMATGLSLMRDRIVGRKRLYPKRLLLDLLRESAVRNPKLEAQQ